jgi:hypothetical protein
MENEKKPYIYAFEKEATRKELREHQNWYFQQGFTGAEAFRACKLALRRWHKEWPADDNVRFLLESIGTIDLAPYYEFALALEEVMDERNAIDERNGNEITLLPVPYGLEAIDWRDCKCCEKCIWGPDRSEIKPYIRREPFTEEEKNE